MADFAACYGSFPAPGMSWRLFLAGVKRAPRQEARTKLAMLESVRAAIAAAFGDKSVELMRRALIEESYPLARRAPVFHPNMFAPDYAEPVEA